MASPNFKKGLKMAFGPLGIKVIVSHYSSLLPTYALLQMVAEELSIWKWIRWSLVVMPKWNKLAKTGIVGFLYSHNKQLQKINKFLHTFKSKITLKHDIQNLVATLLIIDSMKYNAQIQLFHKVNNIQMWISILLHEEITNVPSIVLKKF